MRHYRQFIRDLLDFAGLSSNLAYTSERVYRLHQYPTGGSLIKRFAAKAEVKMSKIPIINVRRSSICWQHGRRGTDNGRQKTRNHGYDVIVSGETVLITPITLANLSRQTQNSNQQARTLPASFPLVGCLPQAWPERLLSKGQDAVALQQIKDVALYL